jgi:uncharacterized protein YxeA
MKKALIAVIVLAILAIGGVFYWHSSEISKANTQIEALNAQVNNFRGQLDQERANNVELSKQAYPEAFGTPKEMIKWLNEHKVITKGEYYSDDAMKLLNEARDEGKWMGVMPIKFNTFNEECPIEVPVSGINPDGFLFCVTMLKDGTVYLVNPSTSQVVELITVNAELKWDRLDIESKEVH